MNPTPVKETLRLLADTWRFLRATRRRRLYMIIPVLINLILFAVAVLAAFYFASYLTAISLPATGFFAALSVVLGFVAVAAVIFVWVFIYAGLTAMIGAPFYSALVSDALKDGGRPVVEASVVSEVGRSVSYTAKLLALFVVLQLCLFIFDFVPVFGQIIHIVGAFVLSVLFVALEFFGETFALLHYSFSMRLKYIFINLPAVVGFSVPVFFLLLMPVVNLFIPPIAMVAAAKIYLKNTPESGVV